MFVIFFALYALLVIVVSFYLVGTAKDYPINYRLGNILLTILYPYLGLIETDVVKEVQEVLSLEVTDILLKSYYSIVLILPVSNAIMGKPVLWELTKSYFTKKPNKGCLDEDMGM